MRAGRGFSHSLQRLQLFSHSAKPDQQTAAKPHHEITADYQHQPTRADLNSDTSSRRPILVSDLRNAACRM